MKNTWTIFLRELKSYFDSPIGYIFLAVFWLVSISLYMWPFFVYPTADMARFFGLLPIILSVFVPAVTMRLWAEEKKLNTFEMLQTFPMTSTQIVLGKYFASVAFYAIALIGTLTIPLMLVILGDPDGGVIVSSYIGAVLLGALYLALGVMFSGFCRDQIIAYVISLLALLGIYLLGTTILDTILPWGLGPVLKDLLGVTEHYNEFTKGVIATVHILYFIAWIAIFLFLNGFFLESRSRKGANLYFVGALALCLGIGLAFNWLISTTNFGRIDMTEDKIFTLSEGSRGILKAIDVPVTVNLYITEKEEMPTEIANLERDITAKLEEMRITAGNKINTKVIHLKTQKYLEASEAALQARLAELTGKEKAHEEAKHEQEKAIEEKLMEKGIQPFNMVANRESGQQMMQLIFAAIGIEYKEKDEEIIPQIFPRNLGKLEYEVISRIFRLTRKEKPVIALVAPQSTIPDYMLQFYMQQGMRIPPQQDPFSVLQKLIGSEDFEVQRIDITKETPLPENMAALVVVAPQGLEDRKLWEINKAIHEGVPTVLAAQEYEYDLQPVDRGRGLKLNKNSISSNLNKILANYGVEISDQILMSQNAEPVTMQFRQGNMAMYTPVDFPTQIKILREDMNLANPITNRLERLVYMWGSALQLETSKLKENKIESTVLFGTGERAWTVKPEAFSGTDAEPPLRLEDFTCGALFQGQFPDAFQGQPRPKWAPKQQPGMPPQPQDDSEEPQKPFKPAPGKVALFGCSMMFSDNMLSEGSDVGKLLVNTLDFMTGGEHLISVRTNEMIDRLINKSKISDGKRKMWKTLNIGGCVILVIIAGIVFYIIRQRGRQAYMTSLKQK